MPPRHKRDVSIVGLAGEICVVAVGEHARVTHIKQAIYKKVQIPPAEQRLMAGVDEINGPSLKGKLPATLTLLRRSPLQVHWLEEISKDCLQFVSAPKEIQENRECVHLAFNSMALDEAHLFYLHRPNLVHLVTKAVFQANAEDRDMVLHVLEFFPRSLITSMHLKYQLNPLCFVSDNLRADRQVALASAALFPCTYICVAEKFKFDKDFVTNALKYGGIKGFDILSWATPFKGDRDMVHVAIAAHCVSDSDLLSYCHVHKHAFLAASPMLRADCDVVRHALQTCSDPVQILEAVPADMRADVKIITEALNGLCQSGRVFEGHGRTSGEVLALASSAIRANKEILLSAIACPSFAVRKAFSSVYNDYFKHRTGERYPGYLKSPLEVAPAALQDDKQVVMTAVRWWGDALKWSSPRLQADKDVVEAAVTFNGKALIWAADEMKSRKAIVCKAVDNGYFCGGYGGPCSIKSLPLELRRDVFVAKKIVRKSPMLLKLLPQSMRSDRDVVKVAIGIRHGVMRFASKQLRGDPEITRHHARCCMDQNGIARRTRCGEKQGNKLAKPNTRQVKSTARGQATGARSKSTLRKQTVLRQSVVGVAKRKRK